MKWENACPLVAQCLARRKHWRQGWLCGHAESWQPCLYIYWMNEWMRTAPCPLAEDLCVQWQHSRNGPAAWLTCLALVLMPLGEWEMAFLEIQGCPDWDSVGSVQALPRQTCPPFPRPHVFFHRSPDPPLFLNPIHLFLLWMKSIGDAGDPGSIPGLGRSPGGGNGNPLQYSCLGNSMDREAWWATVHGVSKSQTWVSSWVHTHTTSKRIYLLPPIPGRASLSPSKFFSRLSEMPSENRSDGTTVPHSTTCSGFPLPQSIFHVALARWFVPCLPSQPQSLLPDSLLTVTFPHLEISTCHFLSLEYPPHADHHSPSLKAWRSALLCTEKSSRGSMVNVITPVLCSFILSYTSISPSLHSALFLSRLCAWQMSAKMNTGLVRERQRLTLLSPSFLPASGIWQRNSRSSILFHQMNSGTSPYLPPLLLYSTENATVQSPVLRGLPWCGWWS